jgi:exodeoxyribonuclease V alpha subunit
MRRHAAVRIFKTYGADAIRLISENPYRLARDIRGIGFKSADQIASKLGIENTAMIRARAGIGYALTEAINEGHCGLPLAQLVPMAVTLLDVPAEIIEAALDLELWDSEVVGDAVDGERCVFLAGLHRAERAIAARIKALSSGAVPWPAIDAAKAIPWMEGKAGITVAASQREAVQLALATGW